MGAVENDFGESMKKVMLLCAALVANTPINASLSEDVANLWKEKTERLSLENAYAFAYSKMIVAGKVPIARGILLSRMQANVTTSKPAIAKLCHDILSRKLARLYPYVHDNFATIAGYLELQHGFFNANSWNAIEDMLRHGREEFYPLIPDWARGIDQHAAATDVLFFSRLFIRRVIEWEREEFYDLLLDEMLHLLTEHDKEVLGYYDSDSPY